LGVPQRLAANIKLLELPLRRVVIPALRVALLSFLMSLIAETVLAQGPPRHRR
jgi:hypothetical protein